MDLRNFLTRKRVRAGSSRDSEDEEDVVPTTSTSDALSSTNSEASVSRSSAEEETLQSQAQLQGVGAEISLGVLR